MNDTAPQVKDLHRDLLMARSNEEGILCIIDGSKGLRKVIDEVFGERAEVQRCQWHKRKNVVGYLSKADQTTWRSRLQRAYQETTYEAVKQRLRGLHADLQQISQSGALPPRRPGGDPDPSPTRTFRRAGKEPLWPPIASRAPWEMLENTSMA
jgi:hypothetical protein